MEDFDGRIVILILFVVISGFKWLMERLKGKGEQHDVSESLEEIYDDFREEIRHRQTTAAEPQAPGPPPLPTAASAHVPPPRSVQAPVYQQPTPVPQQFKASKPELTAAQKAAAERFQQNAGSIGRKGRRKRSSSHSTARALLATPESARQAIILQEILGPPKSMQSS